jgi:hypothetical protein
MKDGLNNILSFLVTTILILMLLFLMVKFSYEMYQSMEAKIEVIETLENEKKDILEDLLNGLRD